VGALRWLGRAAVAVVLLAAATEIAVRMARPFSPGLRRLLYEASLPAEFAPIAALPALMETTVTGWAPFAERDGYVLSSRSLATPEWAEAKPAGTRRLLLLGDSFTAGRFPVARHWTTLAATDLAERTGAPVEPIRLAVPGTGPQFQLRLFEIAGAHLAPDLVVLAFFVGNDFFDELGGAFVRGPLDRIALALRARSLAWRLAGNVTRLASGLAPRPRSPDRGATDAVAGRGGYEVAGFARDYDETLPSFREDAYRAIEAERLSLCVAREAGRFATRLARVLETIDQLDARVRASGARFVVMLIPDEYQVDPAVFAAAARHAGMAPADYDLDRPQRELARALDARGIPVLDLLGPSRRAAADASLYVPRDTHWNTAGHRLAAAELARFVAERRLLP
jgi:hypothetical protein